MPETKNKVEVDLRDLILELLEEDDRDLAWLSRKTAIPYPTLYSCFIQRLFRISEENLEKINSALGTSLS